MKGYWIEPDKAIAGNSFVRGYSGHSLKSWPDDVAKDIVKAMNVGYDDGAHDARQEGNVEADTFFHNAVMALKAGEVDAVIKAMEYALGHPVKPGFGFLPPSNQDQKQENDNG